MRFWIDAQLPPQFAFWLQETFNVDAQSLKELGLRDAEDQVIFNAARNQGTVIITKDSDFIELVTRNGTPPQILWVTCGNVTNRNLKRIFQNAFPEALLLLQQNEMIVEISGN
jgi:predicted nuclease of predicted toxin-antitoxin system